MMDALSAWQLVFLFLEAITIAANAQIHSNIHESGPYIVFALVCIYKPTPT
jgi:hypothetical protein